VLAVAQRELVERKRWLTREEFVELLSVAQVLPGPNIVNLSMMIGDRWFGVRGAMSALAGMLAMPLVIVLVLASLYSRYDKHPAVSGAARHGCGGRGSGVRHRAEAATDLAQ
jgi:chromate transporter